MDEARRRDRPAAASRRTAAKASDAGVDERRLRPPTARVALVVSTLALVGFLLYLGREALSPFIVGAILVYLLDPVVERLSVRLPRWAAVLITYVVVVFLLFQALSFMIRPLVQQIGSFTTDIPSLLAQIQRFYNSLDLPPALQQAVEGWFGGLSSGGGLGPGVFLPVINVTAGFISGIFGYLIIPVWAFYLLKDRPGLTASFDRAVPEDWRQDVREVIRTVDYVFGQWVRGQLLLGVSVGVATFVGLEILNATVDPVFGRFALLLAVSAGVLELLPIIGPIIAAIPALLVALTAGPQAVVAALLLYLLVQQVENNVLVPKIQGDAVEMHPSAVMLSLVIGGAIAGLLGAILALPVTAAGRDVFRYLFRRVSGASPDAAARSMHEARRNVKRAEPKAPAVEARSSA